MSWYRTYRSQTVADLDITPVREAFTRILTSGEFSHAYLLAGPKGTGKTSAARILAKVLNCEQNRKTMESILSQNSKKTTSHQSLKTNNSLSEPCNVCASCIAITTGSSMSVTEMDAASNRGIDDIRELRERIGLSPPDGIISVFIIDEVHMLTTEAFNALLKVLEEPPSHVVFILATTDAQKMPATVVSRCTLIQYRKATPDELKRRLEAIAKEERIEISDPSLTLIATAADGSFRDGVKLFEQVATGTKKIDDAAVALALGGSSQRLSADILSALLKKDSSIVITIFSQLGSQGIDGVAFQKEVLTLAHTKLVEFASTNDKRLALLVTLLRAIAVPIEPNLPMPWLPFEIACMEYSLQNSNLPSRHSGKGGDEPRHGGAESSVAIEKLAQIANEESIKEVKVEKVAVKESTEPVRQVAQVDKEEPKVQIPTSEVTVSYETVVEQWPIVLAKIRKKSVPMEGLLRAIRLVGIDGKNIGLEATYQFHKEQMELSRNMIIMEGILEETFGARLTYNVKLGKAAVRIIGSPHSNVTGNTEDEKLVKAAEEAFL